MKDLIISTAEAHGKLLEHVKTALAPVIAEAAERIIACIERNGTVFWCGNGGSAADSQHLAAELIGRFERERKALPSIALTTDTSILTSVGNDYGYDSIFRRQVEGLVRSGDVLVGISTSGNSGNVLQAVEQANRQGAFTIGLLGKDGGRLKQACALSLVVPAANTARVQEMHILIGHILCDLIERRFVERVRSEE